MKSVSGLQSLVPGVVISVQMRDSHVVEALKTVPMLMMKVLVGDRGKPVGVRPQ